jgi:uncharacterized protein (TIGR02145 family)
MDKMVKKCKESEGCLAKLGREVNADYVCQARIGRFGKDLTIKAELYESKNGDLISSFTGTSKNIYGLLTILDKEAPNMFAAAPPPKETAPQAAPQTPQPTPTAANTSKEAALRAAKEAASRAAPQAAPQTVPQAPSPTPISANTIQDTRDGKKYKIVKIGNQTWMAENLNYHGEDGHLGMCCDEDVKYCEKFGRLYDWSEAMGLDRKYNGKEWGGRAAKHRGICPNGWHLPSSNEWETLVNFVGGPKSAWKKLRSKSWPEDEDKCNYRTKDDRGRITEHNECATDEYGFSLMPNGLYDYMPNRFSCENLQASYLWTSTEWSWSQALYFFNSEFYGAEATGRGWDKGVYMISVRCVRD